MKYFEAMASFADIHSFVVLQRSCENVLLNHRVHTDIVGHYMAELYRSMSVLALWDPEPCWCFYLPWSHLSHLASK